jgi:DNA polymerase/3'-5' exonuclease PolX
MKLDDLQALATGLIFQLRPGCTRIEIAGSVRRSKPDPKDLELVCIPALGEFTERDLFGEVTRTIAVNYLDTALEGIYSGGAWQLDPVVKRNGELYKRLRHVATGIACDLFITDARRWGYTLTIRTGPYDFSRELMTLAHRQGKFFKDCLLHNHPPVFESGGAGLPMKVLPCGLGQRCTQIIETPEETDIFRALTLTYLVPSARGHAVRGNRHL